MSNNTKINLATSNGDLIATEDISGVKHELVKIEFGGDGIATKVSTDNPLPVNDAGKQTDALTNVQLRANPVVISGAGDATVAKQTEQTALLTTLNSLIETNNYLVQFLSQLTGAMNAGAPALRTTPIASVSTAVTGTLTAVTTVGTITNFGTAIPAKEMADDINNFTVTLANINNVTT